jgi:arginase
MPVDYEVVIDLPSGDHWQRMGALYEQVAEIVSRHALPMLVISGDCTTSLGVLAGLQRAGHDVGIVWFDAHADFHTAATTTSGYLGGMPLALAVGMGSLTLPKTLGLRAVPESRVVLVDARSTDPGEQILLERSSVRRVQVPAVAEDDLPDGELYLHVDIDVCDPAEMPGLRYPVPGGPALADVLGAIDRVVATSRVAAIGVAATWHQDSPPEASRRDLIVRLAQVTRT